MSTVVVALLRGVNVGGRSKLAMADLRRIAGECGYRDVATYVQSGNLVLRADEVRSVGARLRETIASGLELNPAIVVRTRDELAAAVEGNPFLDRDDDPTHHHLTFADADLSAALDAVDLAGYAPEAAAVAGRHLYLHLPNGMARSGLAAEVARRAAAIADTTTRNWRTVTKLLAMADAMGTEG